MASVVRKYEGSPFLSSVFSLFYRTVDLSYYRLRVRLEALYCLVRLSKEEVDAFMASYSLFEGGTMNGKDENQIVDYYHVLNK